MKSIFPRYRNQIKILQQQNVTKRSIFLMNIDTKKFSEMFANCIKNIQNIAHHDQVGFIPGMQGWFDIHKSRNVTHHISEFKDRGHMSISIGVAKSL